MNNKSAYKDLDKWRETCHRQRLRYYGKRRANDFNSKKEWTGEDDALVLKHEITDTELSKLIGRSVQAIQIRRSRLKKVGM